MIAPSSTALGRLILGTAPLAGDEISDDEAVAAIRTAVQAGITGVDTAPLYGYGRAERRVGMALAELSRDEMVLSTKVGNRVTADGELVFGFDRDGVFASIEESLARLGTDRLDIVHIHERQNDTVMTPGELAAAVPALRELQEQGVVGKVSVGVNRWDIVADLVRDGQLDLVMVAGHLNLLDRSAAEDFLPLCRDRGIGVIVAGVFATGILATGPVPGATYRYREAPAEIVTQTRRMAEICADHGVPLSTAALHFPYRLPGVVAVAAGVRSVAEVTSLVQAADHAIAEELWSALEGLDR